MVWLSCLLLFSWGGVGPVLVWLEVNVSGSGDEVRRDDRLEVLGLQFMVTG